MKKLKVFEFLYSDLAVSISGSFTAIILSTTVLSVLVTLSLLVFLYPQYKVSLFLVSVVECLAQIQSIL